MVAFSDQSAVSVIVMEVRVSPKVKKHVEERVAQGKCLHCERESYRRGLCTTHYTRYRTAIQELPKKERHQHEAKLIEQGQVVENREGQRRIVNEFRQLAKG